MAFVYEEMTENDKKFIGKFNFMQPIGTKELAMIPNSWTADKEKKLFLICLGGQGGRFDKEFPPDFFYLIWDKHPIKIESFCDQKGDNSTGIKCFWDIDRIVAPLSLHIDSELLVEVIKQAFNVYERRRKRNIISVEFISISPPTFVKGDVANG